MNQGPLLSSGLGALALALLLLSQATSSSPHRGSAGSTLAGIYSISRPLHLSLLPFLLSSNTNTFILLHLLHPHHHHYPPSLLYPLSLIHTPSLLITWTHDSPSIHKRPFVDTQCVQCSTLSATSLAWFLELLPRAGSLQFCTACCLGHIVLYLVGGGGLFTPAAAGSAPSHSWLGDAW